MLHCFIGFCLYLIGTVSIFHIFPRFFLFFCPQYFQFCGLAVSIFASFIPKIFSIQSANCHHCTLWAAPPLKSCKFVQQMIQIWYMKFNDCNKKKMFVDRTTVLEFWTMRAGMKLVSWCFWPQLFNKISILFSRDFRHTFVFVTWSQICYIPTFINLELNPSP